MPKFSDTCRAFRHSPFTFWTTRPRAAGGNAGCSDCADQNVDWEKARPDEIHKAGKGEAAVGSSGAFSTRDYVRSLALNYLLTHGVADHHPECMKLASRRGWWADVWRRQDAGFRLGSRLWTLQWSGATQETLVKARQYAEESLEKLVAMRVAASVSVRAEYAGKGVLLLTATISGPYGKVGFTIEGVENPPYGFLWREVKNG